MNLGDTARGASWMTPEERRHTRKFVAAVNRLFQKRGVEVTPFLALRVTDVAVHHLLVRRLENTLVLDSAAGEATAPGPVCSPALADQIGKARERLRKAVREIEDACARAGRPIDIGIADRVLPIVRQTADLLHHTTLPAQEAPEE